MTPSIQAKLDARLSTRRHDSFGGAGGYSPFPPPAQPGSFTTSEVTITAPAPPAPSAPAQTGSGSFTTDTVTISASASPPSKLTPGVVAGIVGVIGVIVAAIVGIAASKKR